MAVFLSIVVVAVCTSSCPSCRCYAAVCTSCCPLCRCCCICIQAVVLRAGVVAVCISCCAAVAVCISCCAGVVAVCLSCCCCSLYKLLCSCCCCGLPLGFYGAWNPCMLRLLYRPGATRAQARCCGGGKHLGNPTSSLTGATADPSGGCCRGE